MHGAFAILTPVIAAETSVFAQNVVTRNQPGHRVRTYRIADSTHAGAVAHGAGDFAIGGLAARTQLDERLPHLQLKIRAADVHFERRITRSFPDLASDRERM